MSKKTPTQSLNIEKYRIPQNYQQLCDVKQELVAVAIKKPPKSQFIWINPDTSTHFEAAIYEDKVNQEVFIIPQELLNSLEGEWKLKILVPYLIRGGGPAFWPINLADEFGNLNSWPASALRIVQDHAGAWFRLQSNRVNSCYDILKPINQIDPPEWIWDAEDLLDKALRGRQIESLDHPAIKELMGA